MVTPKRRKIAPATKPLAPGADDFVGKGGVDPEIQTGRSPQPEPDPPAHPAPPPPPQQQQQKRGRPATGKRSDSNWVGRTFYIKRETDLDIESLILELKRRAVETDKSELGEILLAAMVKWHKGENLEICLADISPIRKD